MKAKTPSFILTLRLRTEAFQNDRINKRLECGRWFYNKCVAEGYERYNAMIFDKKYAVAENLPKEDKDRNNIFSSLRKKYLLTEYDFHSFLGKLKQSLETNGYKCPIDINIIQKIGTRCFNAFLKLMLHEAKKVYYCKYGNMISLEGKNNKCSIILDKDNLNVRWSGLVIPVIIKKNDIFAGDCIKNCRVKYCRIVKYIIKGKDVFYVQIVFEGLPPIKLKKDGSPRHTVGTGRVGIDDGVSTMAIVSRDKVTLRELAEGIEIIESIDRNLRSKLNRSRRFTNPGNYNKNKTIRKDTASFKKKWYRSKNYMKTLFELREINRKLTAAKKQSHCKLCNEVVSLGTDVFTEDIDYRALAKRCSKTLKDKDGRFKSKKRFGKSILNKTPGMFLTILDQKLRYHDKELHRLNPKDFKASQYNHIDDEYRKKTLSHRWNTFIINDNKIKVQRDLYSSYLMMCVNDTMTGYNKEMLDSEFNNFLKLHDIEMDRLNKLIKTRKLPSCMGVR